MRPTGSARLSVILVLMLGLLVHACASRRAVVRTPPADQTSVAKTQGPAPGSPKTPEQPPETAPLPGQGRFYPSEDPVNQVGAGAPPAFPVSPPAEPVPAPTAAPDSPAAEPPAGDRNAEGSLWVVQVFATKHEAVAREQVQILTPYFKAPVHADQEGEYYKLRIGAPGTREAAYQILIQARGYGFEDAFLVPVPQSGTQP